MSQTVKKLPTFRRVYIQGGYSVVQTSLDNMLPQIVHLLPYPNSLIFYVILGLFMMKLLELKIIYQAKMLSCGC